MASVPFIPRKRRDTLTSQTSQTDLQETLINTHTLTVNQLQTFYDTDLNNGLSEERVIQLRELHGANLIKKKEPNAMLNIFRLNFFGWFQIMLWTGALASIVVHLLQNIESDVHTSDHLFLGISIIVVILFTGILGFYEEAKNIKVMKGFKNLVSQTASVIRDGNVKLVDSEQLVIGDIVLLNIGDIVPADIILFDTNGLKIDMSSLTGESLPQRRTTYATDDNPMESTNLAFSSCRVTEGSAKGVVTAIGNNSAIGKIAGLVGKLEKQETPISKEIKHFIKIISIVAAIISTIFFIMIVIIDNNWMTGLVYMIGTLVANVPEGLIVTFTVALTLTAQSMRKKNCLIKKLECVETLGAISIICSDKTGTLTQNRMTVSHVAINLEIIEAENLQQDHITYSKLLLAASLCIKASFIEDTADKPKEEWKINGDATETAILSFLEQLHSVSSVQMLNPKIFEIPFNSTIKYHLTIHKAVDRDDQQLLMKGAPEVVLKRCNRILLSQGEVEINDDITDKLMKLCAQLGRMGERVIAYGYLKLSEDDHFSELNTDDYNFPTSDYCFLGFISLIDPPKSSVPHAISKCRSAGIKVVMVTGDHPITALSISKKCGIISKSNQTMYDEALDKNIDIDELKKSANIFTYSAAVITGKELREMDDDMLDSIIMKLSEITFARTTPQQKLRIVESCQRIGHVVAVTGDGVNDAPALKKADVGIAMGITGTDVSKESADMILLDDEFSSIVCGIEEGRLIFENLKKSIVFTLTSNTPLMVPFILHALIGIPLPMTAILIICINVLTDLWPAISLAYERAEDDIMKKPPRDLENERLVNKNLISMAYVQVGTLQTLSAMSSYFILFALYGFYPDDLLFTRKDWMNPKINDFPDSYGQEWTYDERMYLTRIAQSTYYASLVVVQIIDVIICKTRRLSIFEQGMSNHMLNLGIITELLISVLLIYIPLLNQFLNTAPIPWQMWMTSMPFAILLIFLDEIRRLYIRLHPDSLIARVTYW